jgi:hypothetical protein
MDKRQTRLGAFAIKLNTAILREQRTGTQESI